MKRRTADSDVEEVVSLFVQDPSIGKGGHKQDGTAKREGADKVAEHDSGRLDANLDIVPAVLARVDSVYRHVSCILPMIVMKEN